VQNTRFNTVLPFPYVCFNNYYQFSIATRTFLILCQFFYQFMHSPLLSFRYLKLFGLSMQEKKQAALEMVNRLPCRRFPTYCSNFSYILCRVGNNQVGISFLQKQLPYDSFPWTTHIILADILLLDKDSKKAYEIMRGLEDKRGKETCWQIEYQRGRILNALNNHQAALDSYTQALKCKSPKAIKSLIYYAIIYSYFQMGRYQEALAISDEVIRLFPKRKGPHDIIRPILLNYMEKELRK